MTRTIVQLGLPLKGGYKDQYDRPFEQAEAQGDWAISLSDEVLDKDVNDFADQHQIEYFYLGGNKIMNKHVGGRIATDVMFALGSFVFVWSYMWYHTESIFLASVGMLMVVLSFPAARTISRYIFGVVWFDFLNQLLLFLLLGIGADALFVNMDAFKQSALLDPTELVRKQKESPDALEASVTTQANQDSADPASLLTLRLDYTIRRASHANFTTSATTAGAFLVNLISGIMPTAGFGIFAGMMILLNLASCTILFPAAIVVHHKYLKRQCGCCKFPCRYCNKRAEPPVDGDSESAKTGWSLAVYPVQERFFFSRMAPFVVKWRIPLLVATSSLVIGGIIGCSLLEGTSESPQFMPNDDVMQKTMNRFFCTSYADHCYNQGSTQTSNTAIMVWGLKPEPDRAGFTRFEDFTKACKNDVCGKVQWDTSFDVTEPEVQKLILQTCEDGVSLEHVVAIDHCIMKDLKSWLAGDISRGSFPVPKAKFNSVFQQFIDYSQGAANGTSFRPFRSKYQDTRLVGLEDGKVKYIIVGWSTPFVLGRLYPSSVMQGVYDKFMTHEDTVAARFKKQQGGGDPYICEAPGHEMFLVMEVANEFERAVYRGVAISLVVALVMLTFSTRNVIVALLALLSITSVTMCTIGCMYMYGWTLGVIEAICAVLVVGFSVDYTVHYGIAYVERRPEHDGKYNLGSARADRVTHSFFELGTSILGGSMTTLGASAFLFLCKVKFFQIFGIFMFTVIFWSALFAHLFFMPCCALFGPEGTAGDIWCPKIFRKGFSTPEVVEGSKPEVAEVSKPEIVEVTNM